MLIAYCEKCGFRVPHDDIQSGAALKVEEKYYCVKCAATMPKHPQTKTTNVRQTPDHQHSARAGESKALVGRPPSGGSHIIAPAPSARPAAAATATRTQTATAKAPNNNSSVVIGGILAGVVGLGLIFISLRKSETKPEVTNKTDRPTTVAVNTPAKTTPVSTTPANTTAVTTPAVTTPVNNLPSREPANTDPVPTAALTERQRAADREMEALRIERGVRMLDESKKWFAVHTNDPWAYLEKLKDVALKYRSTPPGSEAEKLIAELKLPEGDRPPESVTWPRDWDVMPGASINIQDMDGRPSVLHSHPIEGERPNVLRRSWKVPADRPFLAVEVRGRNDGDCHIIYEVNGRILVNEGLGGDPWRWHALDLSALKGQVAEISIQHHNSGWANEHMWLIAPRFVAAPMAGAKVASYETAQAVDFLAGSLVRDTSFEANRVGSWRPWGAVAFVQSDARSGSFAGRVGPGEGSLEQTVIGLKPGTNYVLIGWGKCAGEEARIGVKEFGGAETSKPVNTPAYARYEIPFTTGANNTTAVIYLWKPGGAQPSFGDDFAVIRGDGPLPPPSTPVPSNTTPVATTTTVAPPAEAKGSYRQLFDGKTLNVLLRQGFNGWKVENGAITNTGTEKTSAQTDLEFDNGSIRVRFEITDVQYAQFTARQSAAGGFTVGFDRSQIPSMVGKPQELVFICRGDDVSATLNGQPAKIQQNGKSPRGRLQFYARDGLIRVTSIEFSESTNPVAPPAVSAVATTPPNVAGTAEQGIKVEYDIASSESYALLAKNSAPQALARLEKARADPKLAPFANSLGHDMEFVKSFEQSAAAIQKGIETLADKRAFTFLKTDGKEFAVGKGSKGAVLGFKNNVIQLEQDLGGGGKAMARITIEQLSPRTRYELIQLGSSPGPEGDLRTAFAALLALGSGTADVSSREVSQRLDLAEKAKAPAEKIAHLRERLQAFERSIAAEALFKKADGLARDKKLEDARKLFEQFKTEFADTRAFAGLKASLDQKIAELDTVLKPLAPGLWATFMSGEGDNRFKTAVLSRAETKLCWDVGTNPPDPKVPNDFGIRYRGILRIEREGRYGFFGWCDDHVTLSINGKVILSGGAGNNEGEIALTKGDHAIKIECFDSGGPGKLEVKWRMVGGFDLQEIPVTNLWHDPKEKAKYEKE